MEGAGVWKFWPDLFGESGKMLGKLGYAWESGNFLAFPGFFLAFFFYFEVLKLAQTGKKLAFLRYKNFLSKSKQMSPLE